MAPGTASCSTFPVPSGISSGSQEKPDSSSSTLTRPPVSPPDTTRSTGPMQGMVAVGRLSTVPGVPLGSPPPLVLRLDTGTAPDLQEKHPQPMDHLKRQSPE